VTAAGQYKVGRAWLTLAIQAMLYSEEETARREAVKKRWHEVYDGAEKTKRYRVVAFDTPTKRGIRKAALKKRKGSYKVRTIKFLLTFGYFEDTGSPREAACYIEGDWS
tara:strand:+ start:300 stop:626 length:327 start_codon:yes stop_codon:yes gene_type:complete